MLSEKIVVIDDDLRVIKSIEIAFPEYEIVGFSDGEKALNYLKKPNLINLVLLDVMMPRINGLDVLKELKEKNKDIAVIMMTAFGSMDIAVQALRNHADDFIEKPFDIIELKAKVRQLLKERVLLNGDYTDRKDKVERIKKFVERNYSQSSLDHIANEMCLSSKYVSRLFNKGNGDGFRKYKLKVKIDIAKALLKNSSMMVYEISNKLGYMNPESFMRVFKRETDYTPSEYREKFRKVSHATTE